MKKLLRIIPIGTIAAIAYGIFLYLNPATTNRTTHIDEVPLANNQSYNIIKIADGLQNPRSLTFTSSNKILIAEKGGDIKEIQDGKLIPKSIYTIGSVSQTTDEGLMSIIVDPDYEKNKYIYIAYAYDENENTWVKVVRLTDQGDTLADEILIIDKLPAAPQHAGTVLAFGPDKKLYITVGDATQGERAQFPDYYNGKILRINADGSIPIDNPDKRYATRVLGLRNSQGIARNSKGEMYAIDQGPNIIDGPPGGDEINYIVKGGNYGRPVVHHELSQTGMLDPIAIFTPAIYPTSLMIYNGFTFSERKDSLFVSMAKGQGIIRIQTENSNPINIIQEEKIIDNSYGEIRLVKQGLDGSIYFLTNNGDENNDTLYQIKRK